MPERVRTTGMVREVMDCDGIEYAVLGIVGCNIYPVSETTFKLRSQGLQAEKGEVFGVDACLEATEENGVNPDNFRPLTDEIDQFTGKI